LENGKTQKKPLKIQKGVVNVKKEYYIIDDYDEEIKKNIYYNELMKQAKEIHSNLKLKKDISNIDYNISIINKLSYKNHCLEFWDKEKISDSKSSKCRLIEKLKKQLKQRK
jgi:hypothetical protein